MALSLMIPHSSPPWLLLLSFLFIFHSSLIPFCHSQSSSPQNIETFYPPPPTPSPPPAEPQPPTTESTGSSNGKVVKAVASTAAATFVVCGLIFFIVHRCLRRRRKQEAIVVPDQSQINGFERIGGNVKGLIVDENGLDVVYWRKLQGRSFKRDFQKEVFRNQNREHKENDDVDEGRKPEKVQEFPLLRGKSSTSHLPEGDDYSNRIVITARTNLPPTSAIPKRNSSAPPTTSPPMQPVPARKSSPPARSRSRPPPAPVAVKSSSKPPPTSSREMPATSAGEPGNSSREGTPESGNGQVKLKPLHWDRVNSKADVGSLSVDQDLMEALFGYVAKNRRSPKGGRNDSSSQNRGISSQGQVIL